MTNVVKFPKPGGKRPEPALKVDAQTLKNSIPKVKGVLAVLFLVVRLPLFLVMYWLRLPIIFLCNLVSIPMLLAWLFVLYAFPDKTPMVWGFGICSFVAFVLAWVYDFILMALSPQEMMMTL